MTTDGVGTSLARGAFYSSMNAGPRKEPDLEIAMVPARGCLYDLVRKARPGRQEAALVAGPTVWPAEGADSARRTSLRRASALHPRDGERFASFAQHRSGRLRNARGTRLSGSTSTQRIPGLQRGASLPNSAGK